MSKLTARQQAEAIEQFGEDLQNLCKTFCNGFDLDVVDRVNEIPDQDKLETIAEAFIRLGSQMQDECDAAEDADALRRANALEPDFRRLA